MYSPRVTRWPFLQTSFRQDRVFCQKRLHLCDLLNVFRVKPASNVAKPQRQATNTHTNTTRDTRNTTDAKNTKSTINVAYGKKSPVTTDTWTSAKDGAMFVDVGTVAQMRHQTWYRNYTARSPTIYSIWLLAYISVVP